MNIEDFRPRMCKNIDGQSGNLSIRSTTSKLSLRHRSNKLSLSSQNGPKTIFKSSDLHNDSQRLSPPPSDLWVRSASSMSTPKTRDRSPQKLNLPKFPYLPGPTPEIPAERQIIRPADTSFAESGSTKENNAGNEIQVSGKKKVKTKNIPLTNGIKIRPTNQFLIESKTPEKVFSVFASPQKVNPFLTSSPRKSTASPSPNKSLPSPSKSARGQGSTVTSVQLKTKGFCPICQVPFWYLNVQSSVHSASCQVPSESPECKDGLNCTNKNFLHYRDFHHSDLAEERALASPDGDAVDLPISDLDTDLDLDLDHSPSSKRNLENVIEPKSKRTKTSSTIFFDKSNNQEATNSDYFPAEESNPFFNPDAPEEELTHNKSVDKGLTKSRSNSESSEEPNPFLDLIESSGDEAEADQEEEEEVLGEGEPHIVLASVTQEKIVPCIPGVCDSKQLAVTLTLNNPDGAPIKVCNFGGLDGWRQVQGADGCSRVSVAQCRCKHNLQMECQVPQIKQPVVELGRVSPPQGNINSKDSHAQPNPSAKALWGPLMRKMALSSTSSSASSVSSSSSSSTSSFLSGRRCPRFKLIPGTRFAVDAFNCGDVQGIKFYFLSHFHYDHYIGLTSKWNHVIFCSAITARLVQKQLKVRPELLRVLDVDQTQKVDGVVVTALDANHCPGSLMLLFQLGDGTNHLHTGDFRASPHMESYSAFWNLDVQILFLDTTYCNKQYDFPTQEEVVQWAAERAYVNGSQAHSKCLFVCGSYTIGKEKVFLAIAEKLNCRLWAQPSKARVLKLLEDPRISKRLTAKAEDAAVHILPMSQITLKGMQDHLRAQKGKFSEIVAFRPSGWQFSGEKNTMHSLQQEGNITICGLPYSEHSSFSELRRFVQFLRPRLVVPTVRSKNRTWEQIRATCQEWLKSSSASLNEAYSGTQTSLDHWRVKHKK